MYDPLTTQGAEQAAEGPGPAARATRRVYATALAPIPEPQSLLRLILAMPYSQGKHGACVHGQTCAIARLGTGAAHRVVRVGQAGGRQRQHCAVCIILGACFPLIAGPWLESLFRRMGLRT
jgi:hypothetical protein